MLAIAASLAAVTLATILATRAPRIETRLVTPGYVAVVSDAQRPLWLLNVYPQTGELR